MQRHGFVMGMMGWSEAGDTRKKGASMGAQAVGKNTAGAVLTVHDDAARGDLQRQAVDRGLGLPGVALGDVLQQDPGPGDG